MTETFNHTGRWFFRRRQLYRLISDRHHVEDDNTADNDLDHFLLCNRRRTTAEMLGMILNSASSFNKVLIEINKIYYQTLYYLVSGCPYPLGDTKS